MHWLFSIFLHENSRFDVIARFLFVNAQFSCFLKQKERKYTTCCTSHDHLYTVIIVFLMIFVVFGFRTLTQLSLSWQTSVSGRNQANCCLFLSIFHQIILKNIVFSLVFTSSSPEIILVFISQNNQIALNLSHFALFLSPKSKLLTF